MTSLLEQGLSKPLPLAPLPTLHLCVPLVLPLPPFPAGNMMLFDAEGKIKRYDSPEQILTEFFDLRLQYYEKRRVALLQVRRGA